MVWTSVRTSSSFLGTSARKDNDGLSSNSNNSTPRKESFRNLDSNRISTISSRTKSIDLNISSSPPNSRWMEDKKPALANGSATERIVRKDREGSTSSFLKTNSVNSIATSNYNYPVVNVNNRHQADDSSSRASLLPPPVPTINETSNGSDDKAQKRENLRKQRDNLNWDLQALLHNNNNNNTTTTTTTTSTTSTIPERKESNTPMKPLVSKGADVEGLMTKVWDKQYKETELYIASKYYLNGLV